MRLYWVCCDNGGRCFFRSARQDAQRECDFRMENREDIYGNWFVEEEEIADSEFGACKNDDEPRLPYQPDCCVGAVRKLRSGVSEDEDDGKCGTCPYYIDVQNCTL